jgi:hypothetical protein
MCSIIMSNCVYYCALAAAPMSYVILGRCHMSYVICQCVIIIGVVCVIVYMCSMIVARTRGSTYVICHIR